MKAINMAKDKRLTKIDERGYKNIPDAHIPLDASFIGDIETTAGVRIDGSVKGNVTAAGNVDIGSEGEVEGLVSGQNIHIAGSIIGNVSSPASVQLRCCAKLMGDLSAVSVTIEAGAYFKGRCIIDKQSVISSIDQAKA